MKRLLQRIGILFVIFIAAGAGYFYWMFNRTGESDTVYTSMEESELPVVYMNVLGREMNCLHGYVQEMDSAGLRDSLTVLPDDRNLDIRIARCQGNVTGIYYEIRTLDQSRLLERTSVENWTEGENGTEAFLPIQNLLEQDQEYLLTLTVETDVNGAVRYYTRIVWTDNTKVQQMVDLAAEFSAMTFQPEQASWIAPYLESDSTGNNSNLGRMNIHSSSAQITWGGLAVEPAGEVFVSLKELNGDMASVTLEYLAIRRPPEAPEQVEYYEVEDSFTMRWGDPRIYMMDFERRTDQIFTGSQDLFTGSRILLGITGADQLQAEKSPNGKIAAFVTNGDLWCFDQEERRAANVFSFRSSSERGIRPSYDQHAIRILDVADSGDVDFLVYGYMNRGVHEGCMGVAMYHYSSGSEALEERFFAPVTESFERLQLDIQELAYLSTSGMLYIKVDNGIYAIDLSSGEYMIVAEGLAEGAYAISQDQTHLAWQEGSQIYQSETIHLMNLETGTKNEIHSQNGECVRVLGFVGDDFIYGLAHEGSQWVINGRVEELPMYALEILGENMEVQTRYEKEGYYIAGVTVGDSRIHLKRIVPISGDSYQLVDEDTIVCNEEIVDDSLAGIGWYTDSQRQRIYYVQLDSEIGSGRAIRAFSPGKITYASGAVLNLTSSVTAPGMEFYAYGGGHLLGVTQDFAQAVALSHEKMGTVTDENGQVLWSRVDKPSAASIRNAAEAASQVLSHLSEFDGNRLFSDGVLLLDARGLNISQIQYFLGKGWPVLAYGSNQERYVLTGYDQYNVTLYQPETGESWKMGLNDSSAYFSAAGNDFICAVFAR